MATWGPSQPKKNVSQKEKRSIKLYVTTYTDEFDSERDYLNQEVHIFSWTTFFYTYLLLFFKVVLI